MKWRELVFHFKFLKHRHVNHLSLFYAISKSLVIKVAGRTLWLAILCSDVDLGFSFMQESVKNAFVWTVKKVEKMNQ